MDKSKIISYYLIFFIELILEIVFLFEIPYYKYSNFLKYLKIVRILLAFFIFLFDVYFRVISITETLLNKKEKKTDIDKYFADKNFFFLVDKILIIAGFVISFVTLILNLVGVGLASKEITSNNSTTLKNIESRCSLILLFENILSAIAWIYFSFYWGFYIYYNIININKLENNGDKGTNYSGKTSPRNTFTNNGEGEVIPPAPAGNLGEEFKSSERAIDYRAKSGDNIIRDE